MKRLRSPCFIYRTVYCLAFVFLGAESYRLQSTGLTSNDLASSSDVKNNTLSLVSSNKATIENTKESSLFNALADTVEKSANKGTESPTIAVTEKVEPAIKETNWNLVWKDDFDGTVGTLPRSENWIFDIGRSYPGGPSGWGNDEAQYYTADPDNVSVDGKGNLRITPLRDAEHNWTSARIETTRTDFKPPKGGKMAIEGRIRMPDVTGDAAMGYWPAFWALGSPLRGHYHNWPQIGEFDIMENVNGLNSVWGVLHCGLAPNDPCREKSGLGTRRSCPGESCQSAFHVYRFEWDDSKDPKELKWFVDGEQYHNVTSDRLDEASWNSMTEHSGYFILLNVAMGGPFPDAFANVLQTPTDSTEAGHSMLVDYVAVYDSID